MASVPVGDALVGRIVNPLGDPLDGGPPIETSERRRLTANRFEQLDAHSRIDREQSLPHRFTETDSQHFHAQVCSRARKFFRLTIAEPLDVGAEFFRWEVATATAGAVLGVNPFDEPDVARAKDNTAALLEQWKKTRRLPEWPADVEEDGIALMANANPKPASFAEGLTAHLGRAQPGDYIAIQAYLEPSAEVWPRLQAIRALLRDRLKIATTLGFGPRYLHSTGQLHKGGPPSGLFIQVTGDDKEELPVPGAGYDFSTFKTAQALGDLQALSQSERRVIRLHLTGKAPQGLQHLLHLLRGATRRL